MPRDENYLNKLAYPLRDHKLALKILRNIVSQDRYLSTKEITELLGTNFPYGHKKVRITLERLKDYGYCTEFRDDKKRSWKILFRGRLLLLIFENQKIRKFIKDNSNNRIMQIADILIKSNQKAHVDVLINNLKYAYNTGYDLEQTSTEWYKQMKNIISKMQFNKKKYPKLVELQNKINSPDVNKKILRARKGSSYLDYLEENY